MSYLFNLCKQYYEPLSLIHLVLLALLCLGPNSPLRIFLISHSGDVSHLSLGDYILFLIFHVSFFG